VGARSPPPSPSLQPPHPGPLPPRRPPPLTSQLVLLVLHLLDGLLHRPLPLGPSVRQAQALGVDAAAQADDGAPARVHLQADALQTLHAGAHGRERGQPALHGGQDLGLQLLGGVLGDRVQVVGREIAADIGSARGRRRGRDRAPVDVLENAGQGGAQDGGGGGEEDCGEREGGERERRSRSEGEVGGASSRARGGAFLPRSGAASVRVHFSPPSCRPRQVAQPCLHTLTWAGGRGARAEASPFAGPRRPKERLECGRTLAAAGNAGLEGAPAPPPLFR